MTVSGDGDSRITVALYCGAKGKNGSWLRSETFGVRLQNDSGRKKSRDLLQMNKLQCLVMEFLVGSSVLFPQLQ